MVNAHGSCSAGGIIRSVLGGVLVNIPLAFHITIGNLATYVISYYRYHNGDDEITNEDVVRVLQYGTMFGFVGGLLGAVLERFIRARAAIFVGCCVYIVGCSMSYFTIQKSFSLFVLTYGVINSTGFYMIYAVSIQNAVQWAPDYPGTVSALVSGSCGIGGWIFNLVMTKYVNPHDVVPDQKDEDGNMYFTDEALLKRTPYSFLLLAAIYAAIMLNGVLLIVDADPTSSREDVVVNSDTEYTTLDGCNVDEASSPRQDTENEYMELMEAQSTNNEKRYGTSDDVDGNTASENAQNKQRKSPSANDISADENRGIMETTLSILKTRATYTIWLYVFLVEIVAQFGLNLYKIYGQTFIADDMFLAVIGSFASLSNFFSRPCWGIVMDITNLEISMKLLATVFTIVCGLQSLIPYAGKVAYLVWICVTFGCTTGVWPLVSSAAAKLYGNKNMAVAITIIQTAPVCGVFAGSQLIVVIQDALGWDWLFVILTCFCTIAFCITFLLPKNDIEGNPL